MLNWYHNLYIGKSAKKRIRYYIRRINGKKLIQDVYLITLAANGVDYLDIINSSYLLQPAVFRRCPLIVGIAKGYDEARELVLLMLDDTLKSTGTTNIRNYIMQR